VTNSRHDLRHEEERITLEESSQIEKFLEDGLEGYTYLGSGVATHHLSLDHGSCASMANAMLGSTETCGPLLETCR
jgi:hypothetical protein